MWRGRKEKTMEYGERGEENALRNRIKGQKLTIGERVRRGNV